MNKFVSVAIATIGLMVSGQAMALGLGGNADAGKAKSVTCAACHGPDGNSFNPDWPKLAGQGEAYIYKQLQDFKNGTRQDPLMSGQAMGLSDEDMKDLAAFFSSQTISAGMADADKVALGEMLYRGGNAASGVAACTACHGPAGVGNPAAKFPALSSQHAAYGKKQLNDFRSGTRANDAGRMMRNVAARMTDAEIEAVSSYISGLKH